MRNVLDNVVEEIETHILCSTFFPEKSCRFLDNVEKYGGAREATDDIKRRTRFACWITQTTHTHTLRIVTVIAFSRQQLFRERASVSRYTSLVYYRNNNATNTKQLQN
jgi:hypothetical protein